MASDFFYFKKFSIRQRNSAMKVGTDGVLLGSWIGIKDYDRDILDIGTGTGVIAIMLAQKTVRLNSSIDAVEIENMAAQEAQFNANQSPWKERITVVCDSFQNYVQNNISGKYNKKYNLIVSNPPYFNGSYKSEQIERTAARHTELLSSEDLINGVIQLLEKEKGRFIAIFPYETGTVFIAKAASKGLFCNRICNVYPKEHSTIKRMMIEFSFQRSHPSTENITIAIENRVYTQQYKDLTKDFYLIF